MTSDHRHSAAASRGAWARFAQRYGWRAYATAVLAVVTLGVLVRSAVPGHSAPSALPSGPSVPVAATQARSSDSTPSAARHTTSTASSAAASHRASRKPAGTGTAKKPTPAPSTSASSPASRSATATPAGATPKATSTPATVSLDAATCAKNRHQELVLVSISQQHLWACEGGKQVRSTAVTTGAALENHKTPLGSWRVQAKQRDRYLRGPGYVDYVKYWMPFNGDFGLHDASWQTMPFGSKDWRTRGSHGCVHLPTATMAWLYKWADPGQTVVTIES